MHLSLLHALFRSFLESTQRIRDAIYDWLRPEALIGAEQCVELCQRRAVLGHKLRPVCSLSKYRAKYETAANGALESCQRVCNKCSPIWEVEVTGCSGSHGIPSRTETAGLWKMDSLMRLPTRGPSKVGRNFSEAPRTQGLTESLAQANLPAPAVVHESAPSSHLHQTSLPSSGMLAPRKASPLSGPTQ